MKQVKKWALIFYFLLLSNPCWGEEPEVIMNTGIPDFSGFYNIDGNRYAMISFELTDEYRLTSIEIYMKRYKWAGITTIDLTAEVGPGAAGLLRRCNLHSTRGLSQTFENVLRSPITLKPGTYYMVVSTRHFGGGVTLPYRAMNMSPQVSVYGTKSVNGASPHQSTWEQLDKNKYYFGFKVTGIRVTPENTK